MAKDISGESPPPLLRALLPEARSFIDGCNASGFYCLVFAQNAWVRERACELPWLPEMEAYREKLLREREIARRDDYPIDRTASSQRMSLTALLTLRGD